MERFWQKVDQSAGPESCWPWTGWCNEDGYGRWRRSHERRKESTHRIAFELAHGSLLPEAIICHTCDNPSCCNPAHLYSGTKKTNAEDCVRRGRHRTGREKLTKDDVRALRARSDEPKVQLAREFGIAPCTVSNIIARRIWVHV